MFRKIAVVDYRIDNKCRKSLEKIGFNLINSYRNENIYNAINGHVDINMFVTGKDVVVSPESYDYYRKEFIKNKCSVNLICGKDFLSKKYPNDVLYNICYTGKYYIGNFNYADEIVKKIIVESEIKKKNIGDFEKTITNEFMGADDIQYFENIIGIKQGYSNCSICQVDENSVITYDRGISEVLVKRGIDVLEIEEGHINLFDFNFGFIGGASANIGDSIVFFGDIMKHPDGEKMRAFIEERGKKVISLSDEKLTDYGSMFVF